jgi:hypothetical protein
MRTLSGLRAVRLRLRAGVPEFVLQGHDGPTVVPLPEAPEGFYEELQELPGFDTETLLDALARLRPAEFVCWRSA